ncbi:uncharacterized protein LOC129957155 isoform X1 [Argiope bruennichi]|uniref:Uncharacterized protein n=1 Tax=Argiope bruennichi TaxID=94029 RepID=A0A8T0FHX9_ARGBR|nr:uncharacterized protein LOC129957155 isoform X1 [Argiope bruennichi]KAF8788940.1 hypothetical protein HNY73_006927 [Argiope bruennichi]
MASRYGYKLLKEKDEGSNESISNSGSSAEAEDGNDDRGFTSSCPAVLEPSRDKSRLSREKVGRHKNLLKEYVIRSCPQPSSRVLADFTAAISSSAEIIHEGEQQNSGEHQNRNQQQQQQVVQPKTNYCTSCMNWYNKYARLIRNSWLIHIFQLFVGVESISTIIMGIIFFQGCEGDNAIAVLVFNILLGLSGLLLVYKWVVKVVRERSSERYWNFERDRLVWYFALVFFFLILEFIFSNEMKPITLEARKEDFKCAKTYCDYLYCMHITNAGCLALAALLYLPDCCSYMSAWHHLIPSHCNGHYEPL